MNEQQNLQFRKTLSEALMHLCEPGRNQNEILVTVDRMEKTFCVCINADLQKIVPDAPEFKKMDPAQSVEFRQMIALTLETISTPGATGKTVVDLIHSIEKWLHDQTEKAVNRAIGKPDIQFKKMGKA
jgi:hypothetical protein